MTLFKETLGQQIAKLLKEKILNNECENGMLPKEEDLAETLNVSRGTVRSAMAILEKENLITRIKKRGTFVRGFNRAVPDLRQAKKLNLFYYGDSDQFYNTKNSTFYSFVFNSILAEASKRQYILNVGLIGRGVYEKPSLNSCMNLEAEGNILFAISNKDVAQALMSSGKPCVLVDHEFEDLDLVCANIDSKHGSQQAVHYLYEKGHRKFIFLNHYKDTANPDRSNGVKNTFKELRIPEEDIMEIAGHPGYLGGYNDFRNIRKSELLKYTAMVAFSSDMAFGAIQAMRELEIDIPNDISVVSCGNISDEGHPFLSTVDFDLNYLGHLAVSLLLNQIDPNSPKIENKKVRGFVVDRGSVKDLRKTYVS